MRKAEPYWAFAVVPIIWIMRRKSLYHVYTENLNDFAARYCLNDRKKTRLALELNTIRSKYNLTGAVDPARSDAAIARWISDLDKSIGRIAREVRGEPEKFNFAFEAIEAAAWAWAKDKDDDTLHKMGFCNVHHALGNVSQGIYEATPNLVYTSGPCQDFYSGGSKKINC